MLLCTYPLKALSSLALQPAQELCYLYVHENPSMSGRNKAQEEDT